MMIKGKTCELPKVSATPVNTLAEEEDGEIEMVMDRMKLDNIK